MTPIITLPPAEYYRLRFLQAEAERDHARAEVVALRAAAQAQQTQAVFVTALQTAARAHGFDPAAAYTWHDDTTSLEQTP